MSTKPGAIHEEQIEYAGEICTSISLCENSNNGNIAGLAIKNDNIIVGFFLLKRRIDAPNWAVENCVVVSAMRIDLAHQGKGFGSLALKQLPRWISENWPDSVSIMLSVDEENEFGIKAYCKAGFKYFWRS